MKGHDGFIQAYNAQAAVDAYAQIIVAHRLTNNGLCSPANLEGQIDRKVRGLVAVGRAGKPEGGKKDGRLVQAVRARIRQGGNRSRYRTRKYIIEPVFGHIKQARGFRQFLLRGIDKVKAGWAMICTAHNLAKLTR